MDHLVVAFVHDLQDDEALEGVQEAEVQVGRLVLLDQVVRGREERVRLQDAVPLLEVFDAEEHLGYVVDGVHGVHRRVGRGRSV